LQQEEDIIPGPVRAKIGRKAVEHRFFLTGFRLDPGPLVTPMAEAQRKNDLVLHQKGPQEPPKGGSKFGSKIFDPIASQGTRL
jgi:hypothetical protein